MQNNKHNEGSALLISLIIMGILMMLATGVSELLIGTLRDSRSLLERTEAWYGAESGIERGLKAVIENPPGFEETDRAYSFTDTRTPTSYGYSIRAVAAKYPDVDPFLREEEKFASLGLNESITIPLFRGTNPDDTVEHFILEYFISPKIASLGGFIENDLDILRWKVFGISKESGATEVMNEFVPANAGSSPESPTCFGTDAQCAYTGATFYQKTATGEYEIHKPYLIENFLSTHRQNFLVLTNYLNTNVIVGIEDPDLRKEAAVIKYRLTNLGGGEANADNKIITLPNITITADGSVGQTQQSIDITIPREKFLPVFNYALYRTDTKK